MLAPPSLARTCSYGWGGQGTGACGVSTCPFPPGNGDGTSFFTDTCIYKDPVCRPLDDMEAFDATDQELIGFAIFTEKSFHTGHLVLTAACNCEGNSGIYPAACAALRAAEQYIKDTFKPDTAVDGAFWQKWIDTCIIAAGEALPGCYGR